MECAIIETKFGDIMIRFFPDIAPKHVESFVEIARAGEYDDTTFHRVEKGFVIQGGCPFSKELEEHPELGEGSLLNQPLKAEFSDKPHKRGTVSTARDEDPDSGGSQFFICIADAPRLDGKYTVFGEVVSGMDAVDKIAAVPTKEISVTKEFLIHRPVERIEMKIRIEDGRMNQYKVGSVIHGCIEQSREELIKRLWGSVYRQPPEQKQIIQWPDFNQFCRDLEEKLRQELTGESLE